MTTPVDTDDVEERLVTLECTLAELGYATVRNGFGTLQVIVGEIRIICDQLELTHQSEKHPDWGHVASLFLGGRFVASVNRWINEWDGIQGGVE